MPRLWYDIIAHQDGWAIMLTPSHSDAFPNKTAAFDAAIEYARKLRFLGYSVELHMHNLRRMPEPERESGPVNQAKAS